MAADGADDVEDLMSACRERFFGRLDVVCANVEIPGPPEGTLSGRRMHEWTPADWDQVIGSDARGVFLVIREVLPLLLEARGGCIICTVSNAPSAGGAASAEHLLLAGAVAAVVRQAAIEYAARTSVQTQSARSTWDPPATWEPGQARSAGEDGSRRPRRDRRACGLPRVRRVREPHGTDVPHQLQARDTRGVALLGQARPSGTTARGRPEVAAELERRREDARA